MLAILIESHVLKTIGQTKQKTELYTTFTEYIITDMQAAKSQEYVN